MTKQMRIDMDTAMEMIDAHGMETVAHYMDDDIREALHNGAVVDGKNSDTVFLALYLAAHRSAYGTEFVIN
jgi:hypothetical protein